MEDSSPKPGAEGRARRLLELAHRQFGKLRPAEEKLFRSVALGQPADYTEEGGATDPSRAQQWGPQRALKADRIEWLCTEPQATTLVGHRGICVKGLCLEGRLALEFARIDFPLCLQDSSLRDGAVLRAAELRTLRLPGCHCGRIEAAGVRVRGDLVLSDGFEALGQVDLDGALVEGDVDCRRGRFHGAGPALCADGAAVRGDVYLQSGFHCGNGASFVGARIGGALTCKGADFAPGDGVALRLDHARIALGVRLHHGFRAHGTVALVGTSVGGDLDCRNARFENPGGVAIDARGADVAGQLLLGEALEATGTVRLTGAVVRGSVDCRRGNFLCAEGTALDARRIRVEEDLLIRDRCRVDGAIDLSGASVAGTLALREEESAGLRGLDLRRARVGVLADDRSGWPPRGGLHLNGFSYRCVAEGAPDSARLRLDWLRRQPKAEFNLQPYRSLAADFAGRGRSGDARRVLFGAAMDRTRRARLSVWTQLWRGLAEAGFGYGYRPLMPVLWAVLLVLVGWLVFARAQRAELMVRTQQPGADFHPLVYSVDALVPLVELGQEDVWRAASSGEADVPVVGDLSVHLSTVGVGVFHRVQTVAGWLLAGCLVVGVAGWLMALRRVARLSERPPDLIP